MFILTAAEAIRELYLQLVKKYHPDLALSQSDKAQRHEKMVQINNAYERRDLSRLQQLAGIAPSGGEAKNRHDRNPDGSHASNCWWCNRQERDEKTYWSPRPGAPRKRRAPPQDEKSQKLRAWRTYLGKVKRLMATYGYTDAKVFTMAGGPAVAGEVAAYFYAPGRDIGIYVQVSSEEGLPGPILYRWNSAEGKHKGMGPNIWSRYVNEEELALILSQTANKANKTHGSE